MVSRIDIGPDGGPYVKINENNNDLELQDINGNVIAKWDETAGQWDLNNNSLTGIDAIDASSANVGSLSTDKALLPYNSTRAKTTEPITEDSAAGSITVDLSAFDYDTYAARVTFDQPGTGGGQINFTVNGDTAQNYTYTDVVSGSETSGVSNVPVGRAFSNSHKGVATVELKPSANIGFTVLSHGRAVDDRRNLWGYHPDTSLNSLELQSESGTAHDLTIAIVGINYREQL